MSQRIEYQVTGDPTQFVTAMGRVDAAGREAFEKVAQSARPLTAIFERVNGVLLGMTAVLAGGAFKNAVDDTIALGNEQARLSRQLQISVERAAGLQDAAEDFGISADSLVTASDKLTKTLGNNEAAFAALGIQTRDANGSFRSTGDLLPDVIDALNGIDNVTQQNIIGQQLFGKSWSELRGILRLSSAAIADSEQRVKDLNLVLDPEKIRGYELAMNDLGDVSTSLKVQVGNALLPVLTSLGNFMGTQAPVFGQVFKGVLSSIALVAGSLWLTLKDMGDGLGALAAQTAALLTGNLDLMKEIGRLRSEQVALNEKEFKAFQDSILNPPPPKSYGVVNFNADGTSNTGSDPDLESRYDGTKDHTALYQQALQQRLIAQQAYGEKAKAVERQYWQELLAVLQAGTADYAAVQGRIYALNAERQKQTVTDTARTEKERAAALQAAYREQEADLGRNWDARLTIALTAQAAAIKSYGAESTEARRVARDIVEIERQKKAELDALRDARSMATEKAALDEIAFAERTAQFEAQARNITQTELIAQLQTHENDRYRIQSEGLAARRAILEEDAVQNRLQLQQSQIEEESLTREHTQRLIEIGRDPFGKQDQDFASTVSSLESTWASGLSRMAQGTLNFANALRGVWTSVASAFTGLVSKKVAGWALGEATKTGATLLHTQLRGGIELAAAAKSTAISVGVALKDIAIKAYQAAAGAYAAIAAIPFVGPVLAPVVAAGTLAAVIGLGSRIASAEGGYDIPAGVNPVTQLHEKEMVLPRAQADVVRNLADGGGQGSELTLNVVQKLKGGFLVVHQDEVVKVLKQARRNFASVD